jgi:hypothetical protein
MGKTKVTLVYGYEAGSGCGDSSANRPTRPAV